MPELPEVETIVRELDRAVSGKTLRRFLVHDTKRLAVPKLILPQRILSVGRHGKYLIYKTEANQCVLHLRMTGELLLETKNKDQAAGEKREHERATFYFSDDSVLRFLDVRRFGTIEWQKIGEQLPSMGIDPLSRDFTPQYFEGLARGSKRTVKSFLLDQQKIAGIGNIYADEALWHARIKPARKAGILSIAEAGRLVRSIKRVLREGIEKGGFTLRDYRRIDGSFGYYQKSRKAYAREGERCKRCHAIIKRIKIGGRSSYYCLKCQR